MKKKIFLTGASGTVGYEVLKQLKNYRDRFDIFVFDRKSYPAKKLFKQLAFPFEVFYGDLSKKEDVLKAVKKAGPIDTVIHLGALIPPVADDKPELAHRINVEGTQNLVEALEKQSPEAFLIYSSSISVYGDRLKTPMIKVGDPLQASEGDEYAKTKMQAERVIQNSSLNWTVFRLSAIMGNHQISKLMFHMPLKTCLEITTPRDTARAFCHAIDHKESLSKCIFNLGGGASCRTSYEEFLTQSFEDFGLGSLDFPKDAFADQNFHCGYYTDGDDLENILHFRKDSLDHYYEKQRKDFSMCKRAGAKLFRRIIKKTLLKSSEPFQAIQEKDEKMGKRFFVKGLG